MPPNGYGAASKHGLATTKLVNACRSDLCGRPRAAKTASPWMQQGKALLPLHPIPNRQTQTSKAEVSTWLRTGTFYLALTREERSHPSKTQKEKRPEDSGPSRMLKRCYWLRGCPP